MARRPEKVNAMLAIAAEHPRTFYGMLATRALGFEPEFDWTMPAFGEADMDLLVEVPATKRALALVEVGETARAEDERSEEHTSELQSLMRISYAVFCLKKKKKLK